MRDAVDAGSRRSCGGLCARCRGTTLRTTDTHGLCHRPNMHLALRTMKAFKPKTAAQNNKTTHIIQTFLG